MLLEPHHNTLLVEPVLAWQLKHLFTKLHVTYADGALSMAFGSQHILVHLLPVQLVQRILRRRWCARRPLACFHQHGDNAVQCFVRVHCVAALEVGVSSATKYGENNLLHCGREAWREKTGSLGVLLFNIRGAYLAQNVAQNSVKVGMFDLFVAQRPCSNCKAGGPKASVCCSVPRGSGSSGPAASIATIASVACVAAEKGLRARSACLAVAEAVDHLRKHTEYRLCIRRLYGAWPPAGIRPRL